MADTPAETPIPGPEIKPEAPEAQGGVDGIPTPRMKLLGKSHRSWTVDYERQRPSWPRRPEKVQDSCFS